MEVDSTEEREKSERRKRRREKEGVRKVGMD